MTTKPEVVAWYTPATRDTLPVVALNDRSQRGEPLIRLSDYEALQAECDTLVEALARCRHQASYSIGGEDALRIQLGKVRDIVNQTLSALAVHQKGGET